MILPRQMPPGAAFGTSVTSSGQPPAYTCNIVCGIGIGAGVSVGLLVMLGIWIWYWTRRPRRQTEVSKEAEATRAAYMTKNHPRPRQWVKSVVGTAKHVVSPLTPAHLCSAGQSTAKFNRSDSEDSQSSTAKLFKGATSTQGVESGPKTAPLTGGFSKIPTIVVHRPLSIMRSTPNMRGGELVGYDKKDTRTLPWDSNEPSRRRSFGVHDGSGQKLGVPQGQIGKPEPHLTTDTKQAQTLICRPLPAAQ